MDCGVAWQGLVAAYGVATVIVAFGVWSWTMSKVIQELQSVQKDIKMIMTHLAELVLTQQQRQAHLQKDVDAVAVCIRCAQVPAEKEPPLWVTPHGVRYHINARCGGHTARPYTACMKCANLQYTPCLKCVGPHWGE
jgi:hypothetical protein